MHLRYTCAPSRGAKNRVVMLHRLRRPVLTVLKWQLLATGALAVVSAVLWGRHGAASALVGGLISVTAGMASALAASSAGGTSAARVLVSALRGEAVKLGVAVVLLWLVLVSYERAVVGALVGSFVVTLVIFGMAFFVRDY
jgi:ATP synthase protein I